MGSAFVGLADDLNALYWNPAGLAQIRSPELSLLHTQYLADTSYQVLAYAQPLAAFGTVAGSLNILNYGNIPRAIERPDGLYGGEFGSASPQDLFLIGGWGVALPPQFGMSRVRIGTTVKLTFQQLTGNTLVGMGVGGGVLWDTPMTGFRVGLLLDNVGALTGISARLPLNGTLGASYARVLGRDFRAIYAVDTRLSVDTSLQANMGVEVEAFNMLGLRAGWRARRAGRALGGRTLGLGLRYPMTWFGTAMLVKLDYATAASGELGTSQRFQLSVQFKGIHLVQLGRLRVTKRGGEPVLMWTGKAPAFHVFIKSQGDEDFVQLTGRPVTKTQYSLTGLPAGRYVFRVLAVDPYRPGWRGGVSPNIEVILEAPEDTSAP